MKDCSKSHAVTQIMYRNGEILENSAKQTWFLRVTNRKSHRACQLVLFQTTLGDLFLCNFSADVAYCDDNFADF